MTDDDHTLTGPDLIAHGVPAEGAVVELEGIETLLIANKFTAEDAAALTEFMSKVTDWLGELPQTIDMEMQMGIALETDHGTLCMTLKFVDAKCPNND